MAEEDTGDVECEANSSSECSAAGCRSAVYMRVCVHRPCLRLQGGAESERLWRGWEGCLTVLVCRQSDLFWCKAIVITAFVLGLVTLWWCWCITLFYFISSIVSLPLCCLGTGTAHWYFCSAHLLDFTAWNVLLFFCFYFFQGKIQQLLIVDDPQAAASYCVNYIPDCDSALPYNSHALKLLEVSAATTRSQWLLGEQTMFFFI